MDGQVFGKSCTYGYDLTDRLCEAVFDDGTAYRYTYDANDCLVKEVQTTPDGVRTVTRGYDADSRETSVACGSARVEKTFDKLGRLSSIRRNGGKHTTTYIYETAADGGQTGRIKTVKNGSGQLMAIRYKGADYYYIRDGLMTITGLVDANGAAVVNYRYDSWGMLTGISGSMAGTLGKDNPYRFKGYYYDEETRMYYLKSRYYQPEICRFISADVYITTELNTNGSNMYSYCKNNPVMLMDSDGSFAILAIAGAFFAKKGTEMLVGAVLNVVTTGLAASIVGEKYTLKDAAMAALTGAAGALGAAGSLAAGLISGFVAYGSSREQGEDKTVSFTNAVMAGAFTVGSTGSLSTFLTGSSLIKTATEVEIKLGASAAIGATCDFGYNLMSAAASKAYNSSVHASKKNKVNIQACAIASVIQIAVYKAKSMKKKQNNRRKKGWIDLEGIRKRRTYN